MMLLRRDPTLNGLNTTNYRIVITMYLVVAATAISLGTFIYEVIREHHSMAIDILDSTWLALFGFAGINAAQYAAKRFSDAGYAERKAAARVPDVLTQEHPAKPAVTVNAKDASHVSVDASPEHSKPKQEGESGGVSEEQQWAAGDPRAGIL